jgi:hypothetical protein
MISRGQWQRAFDHPVVEWTLFVIGILLLVVSPLVGILPGPGGVLVAGLGLALVLKTSMWAKRRYARMKKMRVKFRGSHLVIGDWTDWLLRRPSAKRREARRKVEQTSGRD